MTEIYLDIQKEKCAHLATPDHLLLLLLHLILRAAQLHHNLPLLRRHLLLPRGAAVRIERALRPCMTEIYLRIQTEKCAHLDAMVFIRHSSLVGQPVQQLLHVLHLFLAVRGLAPQ